VTRYFKTSNATRPYSAAGYTFTFEPTALLGGLWLGVLAAEEPAASKLAAANIPQVSELTLEQYEEEKKKGQAAERLAHAGAAAAAQVTAPSRCGSCGTGYHIKVT
jgi:hypothetical protein